MLLGVLAGQVWLLVFMTGRLSRSQSRVLLCPGTSQAHMAPPLWQ